MSNEKYKSSYSESSFWDKIGDVASKAGKDVITNALKLYYAMEMGKATAPQIAAIIGALGYFISPVDIIPDFLPGGLVDDAGVLATAIATLSCCSDPEVVRTANEKVREWFG